MAKHRAKRSEICASNVLVEYIWVTLQLVSKVISAIQCTIFKTQCSARFSKRYSCYSYDSVSTIFIGVPCDNAHKS